MARLAMRVAYQRALVSPALRRWISEYIARFGLSTAVRMTMSTRAPGKAATEAVPSAPAFHVIRIDSGDPSTLHCHRSIGVVVVVVVNASS